MSSWFQWALMEFGFPHTGGSHSCFCFYDGMTSMGDLYFGLLFPGAILVVTLLSILYSKWRNPDFRFTELKNMCWHVVLFTFPKVSFVFLKLVAPIKIGQDGV